MNRVRALFLALIVFLVAHSAAGDPDPGFVGPPEPEQFMDPFADQEDGLCRDFTPDWTTNCEAIEAALEAQAGFCEFNNCLDLTEYQVNPNACINLRLILRHTFCMARAYGCEVQPAHTYHCHWW
ncbi:MAG: hypothetical protein AB7P04_07430 [Bacteriovoracia bacterium]